MRRGRSFLPSQVIMVEKERIIAVLKKDVLFQEAFLQKFILFVQVHENLLFMGRQVIFFFSIMAMELNNSLGTLQITVSQTFDLLTNAWHTLMFILVFGLAYQFLQVIDSLLSLVQLMV